MIQNSRIVWTWRRFHEWDERRRGDGKVVFRSIFVISFDRECFVCETFSIAPIIDALIWIGKKSSFFNYLSFFGWNVGNVWDLRENESGSLRLSNRAKVDVAQSNYRLRSLSTTSRNCRKVTANKKTMELFSGTKAHYLHETSFVTHGKIALCWDNSARQSSSNDFKKRITEKEKKT